MRMKKIAVLLVAGVLAAAMLTGCGKGNNETENAQVESTDAPRKQKPVTPMPTQAIIDYSDRNEADCSLYKSYSDRFDIGVAVNSWQLADKDTLAVITKDFSTITMENEMKPDYILDYDATMASGDGMPEIRTDNLDNIMTMAEEAGLKMRAHTLVWHSQTPQWLFYEDYDTSKEYVDRETMLKRLEAYIEKVMTYCKEEHPGVIVAWDVVNEAFSDSATGGYRGDSPWYLTIGEDYIEKAFTYARKYQEDGAKLYLNDYNCLSKSKRDSIFEEAKKLAELGVLDGIGMQSHYDMNVSVDELETALFKFSQIEGIDIQLTELDMHNNDNSDAGFAKQADVYSKIFEKLLYMEENGYAEISNVTFWGLTDRTTWLTGHRNETSYPLMLNEDNSAKPCYFAILDVIGK